jgi:hypothetical protein
MNLETEFKQHFGNFHNTKKTDSLEKIISNQLILRSRECLENVQDILKKNNIHL